MKSKIKFCFICLLIMSFLSFTSKKEIENCLISFTNASNLTATIPDRLPEASEKARKLNTEEGEVEITRLDGYRVLYNNDKKVPFVNLKVELSDEKSYKSDQKGLIENLKYLNSHSSEMETKDIIELKFNGYKIFGLSRKTIERGSILGTFIMFPGNNVTVYFYFNNLKPEFRNFESVEDYKKLRDKFMDEYTRYLIDCKNK
jgi:hypothetical protein